jgi:hypothetical protein
MEKANFLSPCTLNITVIDYLDYLRFVLIDSLVELSTISQHSIMFREN